MRNTEEMKFLVIGLGSMGKRRVRCLKTCGISSDRIHGFDPRSDRRSETAEKYQIVTLKSLDANKIRQYDALVISTPPANHLEYLEQAVDLQKPAFVEASVLLDGLPELAKNASSKKVFLAPSCTLRFHPAIQDIKSIVESRKYGRITNFSYHSGQFLPDWHPWEPISAYYVSRKDTGGGREIVPFELTWLCDVFGLPTRVKCLHGATTDVGAEIDDTYALTMQFKEGFGQLIVDVVARVATRSFILNLEYAQVLWNWERPWVDLYDAKAARWIRLNQPEGKAEAGYNKNIVEEMYIKEIRAFLDGISNTPSFPNTMEDDIEVLKILNIAENDTAKF